ncbi:MAG TPA: 1-acyl-sn-glycerol-3-phosphate acyltransferase [Gammaproteobacteria bacterium]|nr:1-acyl-sn-glycerol-3-phosphate acyltransferase [Gammaproteobacteria bacterium]
MQIDGWVLAAGTFFLGLGWFLLRFLRRCEEVSPADWGGSWHNRLAGMTVLFCRHFHRLPPDLLPLPAAGPVVVASNHVSGLDPLLLIAASPRPLRFLIAREEYERFGLTWLFHLAGCIPVDRSGRPERALREALRVLGDGEVIAVFPHGKIHLDADPPRRIKGGAVRLAQRAGCPILPLRVEGVRGEGHTLLAVLLRSRAWIRVFPPLDCQLLSEQDCLSQLTRILQGETTNGADSR